MQPLSISDNHLTDVKIFQFSANAIPQPFHFVIIVRFLELQICDKTIHWLETTVFK